jgi:hypothetical protein
MGGNGEGMERGRSVYKQPGTKVDGSYHDKEGFQVSKREVRLKQQGTGKGNKRQRGLHILCCQSV